MRLLLLFILIATSMGLLTGPRLAHAAEPPSQESVRGFLRVTTEEGKRMPLAGVRVVVRTAQGPIGEARSDAKGAWTVALPSPGQYTVELDETTLPPEFAVRGGASNTLSLNVLQNEKSIAVFPLAPRDSQRAAVASRLVPRILQLAVDGAVFGVVLAMAAIGLSLVYGVTRIVNFAHGDVVSFAALLAVFLNASLIGPQLDLVVAAALTVIVVSGMGPVFEALFGKMSNRATDHFTILVFSIGISFVLRHALLFVFGPGSQPYRQYTLQDLYQLGPIVIAPRDVSVVVISIVILVAVGLLLLRTRIGQAMRAVSTNPNLAEQSGIDVKRIRVWTWILGTALAAVAGILLAVSQQARWSLGYQLLMFVFAAVILGGIGTAFGAMVGGILIGLIAQISTIIVPAELKPTVAMAVLVLVLLYRPLGLFNRVQRIG